MKTWIESEKQLPPEGKYVIGRHNRQTWIDPQDQEGVNYVIVKLKKGISQEQRAKMISGELPDPIEIPLRPNFIGKAYKRSEVVRQEDEHGNNLKPYYWNQFGPDSFFGQDITHWAYIPEFDGVLPEKKTLQWIYEPKQES